jgi:hypothetical protein
MMKNKKFWSYEMSQVYDLKQEQLDGYKQKGRVFEDFNYFFELMSMTPHPALKQSYGKEHTEPNSISFINNLVDLNTLKILFQILPNSKIVTLKFSNNNFDFNNLEFLINSLLTKQNFIFNFIFEWNYKIKFDGSMFSFADINSNYLASTNPNSNEMIIYNNMMKAQQLLCKIATSPKIEALCLRGNYLGDENASILFETLKNNQSLRILNLYKNNLTSKCIQSFCLMIEANKKLEELNIGGNFFTDDDLGLFKNYVGKIPMSTEEVEIHNKKVKERDAIVEKNKKLKIQKKPEEPVPILDEVIQQGETFFTMKNNRLKNINLMQNSFSELCYDTILYIMEMNSDLMITIDGPIFKNDKEKVFELSSGKFSNRIYLTK